MLRFMFIRILQALPVIFVVITATFFLVRSAPGGPFDQEKVVIPEVKKALEALDEDKSGEIDIEEWRVLRRP